VKEQWGFMAVSTLTPSLTAAVEDTTSGATDVVRQVVDGLLVLTGDPGRLRAAAELLTARLAWCGPMWQVTRAVHDRDPAAALRSLRHRLDTDAERSIATAVRLLTRRDCAVRTAPGSGLVAAVLAALPERDGPATVGLAGADAISPTAVLNIAGTGEIARSVPTIVVATSVKVVPPEVFETLGAPGFETVELGLFEAVVLDGEVLSPAQTGRRVARWLRPGRDGRGPDRAPR
jgi:hypothetical protein